MCVCVYVYLCMYVIKKCALLSWFMNLSLSIKQLLSRNFDQIMIRSSHFLHNSCMSEILSLLFSLHSIFLINIPSRSSILIQITLISFSFVSPVISSSYCHHQFCLIFFSCFMDVYWSVSILIDVILLWLCLLFAFSYLFCVCVSVLSLMSTRAKILMR